MLRTGLGLRHGYTREQVARILRVTLGQEGRIELQAIAGLTAASAHGRCANHTTAIPPTVLRAVNALLAAASLGPATSTKPSGAASPGRQPSSKASRGSRGATRSNVGQRPPASSASIAPPEAGGLSSLSIALAIALAMGLAGLWLLVGGRRSHHAAALAGALGLAGPVDGASARRRGAHAAPPSEPAISGAALASGIEAFDLGVALAEKRDLAGAEAAFRYADEQGHPCAASNLGVLLEHRGDRAGAEAAYRRADQRGDATGAFNLGAMLAEQNDLAGAEAAFRRADERGDGAGALNLGALLERRNARTEAEAAYTRALERTQGDEEDLARTALSRVRTHR